MQARTLLTIIAFVAIGVIVFTLGLAVYDANTKGFHVARLGYGAVLIAALGVLASCVRALRGSRSIRQS